MSPEPGSSEFTESTDSTTRRDLTVLCRTREKISGVTTGMSPSVMPRHREQRLQQQQALPLSADGRDSAMEEHRHATGLATSRLG